ncbi:hypothetical protein TrispH2_005428 [Trichoplax sp. H2]|nr:hypothetical protein TrispH2_005428 [Trichoplax sp. H2]|eukprot:RDD42440.1 hypothetical protein TrispH2_005428 [Trichoplax sp. H2]
MAIVITNSPAEVRQNNAQRAKLMLSMRRIGKEAVSFVVVGILLLITGGIAFSPARVYLDGVVTYGHCFWVAIPMIVAGAFGIATYNHGNYRRKMVIPHLVFLIVSMAASIGGMVILGVNIYHFIQRAQQGHIKSITALGINIAVLIVYVGYFFTGLYCVVVFSRIAKSPHMASMQPEQEQIPFQLTSNQLRIGQQDDLSQPPPSYAELQLHHSDPPPYEQQIDSLQQKDSTT